MFFFKNETKTKDDQRIKGRKEEQREKNNQRVIKE